LCVFALRFLRPPARGVLVRPLLGALGLLVTLGVAGLDDLPKTILEKLLKNPLLAGVVTVVEFGGLGIELEFI